MLRLCLSFLLVIACNFTLAGCSSQAEDKPLMDYAVLNPSKDFTLTDQDGKPFNLKDHRGEIVLLFFGYISCPDVCPTTLSKLSRVYKLMGDESKKLLTVFVTVDTDRDTPSKLREYLEYFKLRSVGLTGTKAQVDTVVNAYKASYEKVEGSSAMGYLYNHSDYLYLIDQDGKVRYLFHTEDKPEDIVSVLKKL